MNGCKKKKGFSLVELSIVLVILGLLVGGVLSGQSLIRAAEMRSVMTEVDRYTAATHTFRDKYFALAGDMTNATNFWGRTATGALVCASTAGLAAGTPGTCDGNGDGHLLTNGWGPSTSSEMFQFWRQLMLAGLIEGNYSGYTGPDPSGWDTIGGTNVPVSRASHALWYVYYLGNYAGNSLFFPADYGNAFQIGAPIAGYDPEDPAFKAEEAWNIDSKMDDGKPNTGKVLGFPWGTCTSAVDFTTPPIEYRLDTSDVRCGLMFARGV